MEYITLQNSDLKVSRICMGGCPLGGYGWGKVEEEELVNAVKCAVDEGVNFFDTAETYGLGHSEITLGKALGDKINDVVISDKFGVHAQKGQPTFYDNSREYIISACEGSLKRLGRDYIDVYTVHYRDGKTPLSDVVETLEILKKDGKIRYYALSNVQESDIPEIRDLIGKFVCFQNEYSLACRKYESLMFNMSENYKMTPMTWGSLGQGVLTGKYTLDNINFREDDRRSREIYVNFHGNKFLKNLEIVEVLRQIANERNKTVSSVALRFNLDFLKNSIALVGIKKPKQIKGNVDAVDWNLTPEEINRLCKISQE